jgi:hypothetical protein
VLCSQEPATHPVPIPVCILSSSFLTIHFVIVCSYTPSFPRNLLFSRVHTKNVLHISLISDTCYVARITHFSWFIHPRDIWRGITYVIITNSMKLSTTREPLYVRPLDSFPAFYGTRRFNTEFIRALHLFLS